MFNLSRKANLEYWRINRVKIIIEVNRQLTDREVLEVKEQIRNFVEEFTTPDTLFAKWYFEGQN